MRISPISAVLALALWSSAGRADMVPSDRLEDDRLEDDEADAPPAERDSQASAPYSLPFQMRSVVPSTSIRLDQVMTPYRSATDEGVVGVTSFGAAYKLIRTVSISARLALVEHSANGSETTSITNPVVGGTWGDGASPFRYALALSAALPLGSGGGNHPNPAVASTNQAGHSARFALDGSWFSVNDFAASAGGDLAYVFRGLTLQGEATVTQLFRARGEQQSPDAYRANFLSGVHLGFWAAERLCIASEVRYQRWISTPAAVESDPFARHNLSIAAGLRTRIGTGSTRMLPGVAYATGLAGKVGNQHIHAVHVDLPVAF
jgi:hypothetical protein